MAVLEVVNVAVIGWFVFGALDAPVSAANAAGFLASAGLLLVGAAYWMAKLGQVRSALRRPRHLEAFRLVRIACLVGLLAAGVVVAAAVGDQARRFVPGLVLFLLAVAEYVNYFFWQLMYDNRADLQRLFRTRRLARAHLHRDLRPPTS